MPYWKISGTIGQIAANVQAAKIGAPQETILKGAPIAEGRSAWTLNNTPKTTTVGVTPKTASITIGDIEFGVDEVVGYKFVNEQSVPMLKEGPTTTFKGEYTKTTQSLVQANRTAGNAFRDELAAALRAEGREVTIEAFKKTPYGKRFIDIEVIMPNGKAAGIETKVGGSRYHTLQRLKDDWLKANGYPVQVVRQTTK